MRIFTFCLFYFFCISTIYSQSPIYEITGKVLSKNDSSEIVNAVVHLQKDKSITESALTDANGFFRIQNVANADYLIISYIGVTDSVKIKHHTKNVNLGNIFIKVPDVELNEVVVTAQMPIVRYEEGKTIFNIEALPNTKGSDVLDALGKIPGVQHTNGQGLKLNGFESVVLLIDKRPIRMDKMELENYLSSISVSDIASVELIRNPGDQYGSNGTPVLNIITKKHIEDGYSGFANSKLSFQHYLSEYIGLRFNLNKGISRSYLSYSFGESRTRETTEIKGISLTNEETLPRQTHQLGIGSRLNIGSNNYIDINISGTLRHEKFFYDTDKGSKLIRPHIYTSVQHTYNNNKIEIRTILEGSSAFLKQNGIGNTNLQLKDYSNFVRISPVLTYKTSHTGSIFGGISYDYTNYLNKYISKSSSFLHIENHTSASIGINKRYNKLDIQTGLENHFYKYKNSGTTDRCEFIILPRFNIGYQLAKNHQISAEMKSIATRPDFRDITPITTHGTASWDRIGNPDIQTAKSYIMSLRYSFMGAAQMEFSFSDTDKPIVEQPIETSAKNISLIKSNLDNSRYIRALIVLPIPLLQTKQIKWFATSVGAFQRQWDRGNLKTGDYSQSFNTYYLQHRHDISISTSWAIGLSVTRYGSLYFGLYKMQPMWWFDASLSKRIGNWRITASVYDPFNTNMAKGSYEALSTPISFVRNWHLPRISFGISYNLGNISLKSYKNGNVYDNTNRMRSENNEGVARNVGL